MCFLKSFEKLANPGGHNNQGLEFKHMDTEPQSNVGPGGMSPTGIFSYQPLDSKEGNKSSKGSKNKMPDIAAAQFIFGKMAAAAEDSVLTGSSSQIANGIASQLKWTSDTGSDYTDKIGDTREKAMLRKQYLKARKS